MIEGKPCKEVIAHVKDRSVVIVRDFADQRYVRGNVIKYTMSPYLVALEGEEMGGYYGQLADMNFYLIEKNEHFGDSLDGYKTINEADILFLNNNIANSQYVINKALKWSKSLSFVWKVVKLWIQHPECESLIERGMFNLAFNKSLYKLTKPKLKSVLTYIKKCDNKDITLSDIQLVLNGKDIAIMSFAKQHKIKYNYAKYLVESGVEMCKYTHYISVCKTLNKDLKDKYWYAPSDFSVRYDVVIQELETLREAQEIALEEAKKKEQETRAIAISNLFDFYHEYNCEINGYDISLPISEKDIIVQAQALSQCLIKCRYDQKYANQDCILVFVKKNGEPIATMELDFNKKVVQFRSKNNSMPSKEVEQVANKWLENFVPHKFDPIELRA